MPARSTAWLIHRRLLAKGWQDTLFNQFHDILPGSGVHATYEYSEGLYQAVQAAANSTLTRALRRLAAKIDTTAVAKGSLETFGDGLGDGLASGAGDPGIPGTVSAANAGAAFAEPVLIYNPKPWARAEMVYAKVWNKPVTDDRVLVRDAEGNQARGQVVERGDYWGHNFTTVAFRADIAALGYKVYGIDNAADAVAGDGASAVSGMQEVYGFPWPADRNSSVLENEYLKVEVDWASGAVSHLIDKETGFDYVPAGKLLGLLEAYQEDPHSMTSWCIGQVTGSMPLAQGGRLSVTQRGPNRAAVKCERKYRDSTICVEIGLNSGSRTIDFTCTSRWVERGSPETGVPMLKVAFPVAVQNGEPVYEIPFGSQRRVQSYQEVPALKWADLSGETDRGVHGITLVNDSKYGHSCVDDTLRLTLIRSSYDPDPLPEIADHTIKFAVVAHTGAFDVVAATRAGEEFNSPMAVASTTLHKGDLPPVKSFIEALTPNVFVSAAKKAEDSGGLVVRMFESSGKDTTARIRISGILKKGSQAVETDILERPLSKNTASLEGDILSVKVPAYGQASVKVG